MQNNERNVKTLLEAADKGISQYLHTALEKGRIDKPLFTEAQSNTFANLRSWIEDPEIDRISPNLKQGIFNAIQSKQWEHLVNAFRRSVRFGTGGIRGMMAFDRKSILRLKKEGIGAPILKGPNTINDLVLLQTSVGVAKFGKEQAAPFEKVVIGYDSRIRGHDLAKIIAELFLHYDYTVYFFDSPCPYPEVTFAIPYREIQADLGILISASHNDYRYNGYKLSCGNGSQFDPEERDIMYNRYIAVAKTRDIQTCPFSKARPGKLYFLSGEEPVSDFDYVGRWETSHINVHAQHREHVRRFFMTPDLADRQQRSSNPLRIGYCAFHGAGRIAVPRLLHEVGFTDIRSIKHKNLDKLDGLFPCFNYTKGHEQQPDPGDPRSADIAVEAFKADYPAAFDSTDILIGTDPDADRCGIIVKVPENQRHLYRKKKYMLLPADDAWALLLWYRLKREKEHCGQVKDIQKKFIVLSHTTSDSISRLVQSYGIGVVKTWVGFASLSASTRDVWEHKAGEFQHLVEGRDLTGKSDYAKKQLCHPVVCGCTDMNEERSFNIGALEQSNGFSILGGPPANRKSLGADGHVRDKDGTFAALLMAEIAAWAKENNTTLVELLDQNIYLNPKIGLFVNLYEPDPLDGEYPGIEGDRMKIAILRRALGYFQLALTGDLSIGGHPVKSACIYRTGKYDAIYPPSYDFQFPDEGVRFFFDDERLDHVIVRPSGTGNSLRFHVQLHAETKGCTKRDLIRKKEQLHRKGKEIMDGIRELVGAPRN